MTEPGGFDGFGEPPNFLTLLICLLILLAFFAFRLPCEPFTVATLQVRLKA
jgi:hypothetical protein